MLDAGRGIGICRHFSTYRHTWIAHSGTSNAMKLRSASLKYPMLVDSNCLLFGVAFRC